MARINYEKLIENLPDAFAKDTGSNNYKLLQITKGASDMLHSSLKQIFRNLSLNIASGKVLDDFYGGRINLKRGSATDIQYRILLIGKIMQSINTATHPEILEALAYILQCNKSDIHIVPYPGSNGVIINNIPLQVIGQAGFSIEKTIELVNALLPAGVEVKEYSFSGTFILGEEENEIDTNAGFADDNETYGGYLGL